VKLADELTCQEKLAKTSAVCRDMLAAAACVPHRSCADHERAEPSRGDDEKEEAATTIMPDHVDNPCAAYAEAHLPRKPLDPTTTHEARGFPAVDKQLPN
jgi:hypothetical protein